MRGRTGLGSGEEPTNRWDAFGVDEDGHEEIDIALLKSSMPEGVAGASTMADGRIE
jgi:hypothetical protein